MNFPSGIPVFGDKSYRGECSLESTDQKSLVAEIRRLWPDGIGELVIHPRNEGKRSHRRYQREYLDGMTTGASDIIIPGAPALCLELKRKDHTKSRLSQAELDYLHAADKAGCFAVIALGWEAGIEAVKYWRQI